MILVKVEWWDAHSTDPWHACPEAYIPMLITSVGYLHDASTPDELVLSEGIMLIPNKDEDNEVFGTVHIPRGCIKSIQELDDKSATSEKNNG